MPFQSNPIRSGPDARLAVPTMGVLLLAGLTLVWGVNWPVMKISLNEIPPWTFRAMTTPVGGLVLLICARASGRALAVPRRLWGAILVVALFNSAILHLLSSYGLSLLSAGRAAILVFTMPIWASVFAVFVLGEAMTPRRVAALLAGAAGIATLMWGELASFGATPKGAAMMLGAALSWALGTVLLKRIDWSIPTVTLTGWQLMIGGVPLIVGSLAFEVPAWQPASLAAWAGVFYNVFAVISLGTYLWVRAVRLLPAGVSALGSLMIPVIGVISGALWLGEPLGWREAGSLVFILAALWLTLFGARADSLGRP